jgi:hypothetical protein
MVTASVVRRVHAVQGRHPMLFNQRGKSRRVMTQPKAHIARPRAPGWLTCELCERPASRPHRRLRLTLVRHNEEQAAHGPGNDRQRDRPDPQDADGARNSANDQTRPAVGVPRSAVAPRKDAANPAILVLLCADCCALIVGAIDDDEWRKRILDSPGPVSR